MIVSIRGKYIKREKQLIFINEPKILIGMSSAVTTYKWKKGI